MDSENSIVFGHVDQYVKESVEKGSPAAGRRDGRSLVGRALLVALLTVLGVGVVALWMPWLAAVCAGGVVLVLMLRRQADSQVDPLQRQLWEKYADEFPGMLYQCRLYPNGHCVVTYANRAMEWIYEMDRAEMARDCRPIFDLVHPEDKERIEKLLAESAKNLTSWKAEFRVILPQQGERWRSAQARVERLVDGSTLWHGYVVDVTSRREDETRVRQAEEREAGVLREARDAAKEMAAQKARFLAEMSHEIRTPIGCIRGYAELMKLSSLDLEQVDHLTTIEESADHLLDLINNTLDTAKIEAGQIQLKCERFALRASLEQIFHLLRPNAMAKGLLYHSVVDDSVPDEVKGDRIRVGQILTNLLSNAIKYTEKGRVDMRVKMVGDQLELMVQDTGMGIAPEDLERVFSPYVQVGKNQSASTGLGLAIARDLCRLMDGDLVVESTLGEGSRFVARLGFAVVEPA